jgi:hypothetical protein
MEKRNKEQEKALERIGETVSLTSMTPKLNGRRQGCVLYLVPGVGPTPNQSASK